MSKLETSDQKELTLVANLKPSKTARKKMTQRRIRKTKSRAAEEQVKQLYEEWETTVNALPDPVSIHDRDFRIIKANRAFARVVGMEQRELIGKKCYEIIHRTRQPWCNCPHKQAVESKKPVEVEVLEPYLGLYMKVSVSPILNESNEVVASIHTAKDITDLKKLQEELRKKTDELGKRVKELRCLYALSNLLERPDISLPEIFQGFGGIVRAGWQYPEITCVRVILKDRIFETANFRETISKQSSPILVDGEQLGTLEVYYLEERPECSEGPFLKEERELLNALASQVGRAIQLIRVEATLRERKWSLTNRC